MRRNGESDFECEHSSQCGWRALRNDNMGNLHLPTQQSPEADLCYLSEKYNKFHTLVTR